MSIETVTASLIWENNSDTLLNANNLSKTIDYQSESKFIYFTDTTVDYESWADLIIQKDSSVADPFSEYCNSTYKDKVIYNITTHIAKKIAKSSDGSYYASAYNSPYKKLLKILANTKITMDYTVNNITYYNSFDIGSKNKIFSSDHLISDNDFQASSTYDIYLYYHISYGDYAQIKIMNKSDSSWKTTATDTSSPTGYKLISYRKIGGFKTDENGYIIENSIWDISTMHTDVIAESLKMYDSATDTIRSFTASDVPITDSGSLLSSSNVEDALQEVKKKVDTIYDDLYLTNKYGMDLQFCPIKKSNGSFTECDTNDLTLKITAGYMDVFGTRIEFNSDVYLSNATVKINGSSTKVTPAYLGAYASTNLTVYDESSDGSGTIWRVYVDMNGNILVRSDTNIRPQYYYSGAMIGWYCTSPVARCIGKFMVRKGTNYYIVKQSVINTVEREMIPNEVIIIHGTMCPDGTVPCDGKWHDVIGNDANNYTTRPALSTWSNNWYEETPNMLGKTIKMASTSTLSTTQFKLDSTGAVVSGGSNDCGASGGSDTHTHVFSHSHAPGTLSILESGDHTHEGADIQFVDESTADGVQVTTVQSGTYVSKSGHTHTIIIGGGSHSHSSTYFSGATATVTGTNATSASSSSWAPYKEFLFCIKK